MRRHWWCTTSFVAGLAALLVFTTAAWSAQIRVATYTIQLLSTDALNQGGID